MKNFVESVKNITFKAKTAFSNGKPRSLKTKNILGQQMVARKNAIGNYNLYHTVRVTGDDLTENVANNLSLTKAWEALKDKEEASFVNGKHTLTHYHDGEESWHTTVREDDIPRPVNHFSRLDLTP